MKTKLLITSLVAAGMLAAPFAMAQQGQGQMPGQTQPSGPTPMPAPGQAGAMPPSATPMPPASQGRQPRGTTPQGQGMSQGSQGMSQGSPGMSQGSPGMSQGSQGMPPRGSDSMSSPGRTGSQPMGAQSPYAPQKWNKGDRLPAEFRDRQYVIDKYKDYNLPAPRKGYHWVGVGADYYQVSSNGTIYSVGPAAN